MEQAGLPMENYGVSQQIHNTGPIPVIGPSGFSSYLRSCSPGRVPKEYYGDSDSLSSPRSIDPYMNFIVQFRRSMEYSSYTESSETSSSSDSNMSSNEHQHQWDITQILTRILLLTNGSNQSPRNPSCPTTALCAWKMSARSNQCPPIVATFSGKRAL
ncbi:GD17803 [Drosophila simulans]|uniref:GD17803 n=1 Tax=Drosophila simulans TaxID=7240 RepID=B4Q8D6_DROSI|nr:GD17803 [Drosophila simulans]